MLYTHDISRALESGAGAQGAGETAFDTALLDAGKVIETLRAHKENGACAFLGASEREDDLGPIENAARRIADHYNTLVVVGMGASARCPRMLTALAVNPFQGRSGPRVHYMDNIDPFTSDQLLEALDFRTTAFLLVSKSGDTAETLAHALILTEAVSARLGPAAVRDRFVAVTRPGDSPLRRMAGAHAMAVLDHPADIGGRFAALTVAGLLPARVAGLDIRAVRRGAQTVLHHAFTEENSEPARGAALQFALCRKGKAISVLMPYCDRLEAFGAWYEQVWAESLGKRGNGSTPLLAPGASAQHSQLQLYLDGPRDKLITLICLAQKNKGPAIPRAADEALGYLEGRTLGDLMDAEQRATAETLAHSGCPLRMFSVPRLEEETLGALIMHVMLETVIMADLLGVDAFDQPAVEEGKRLAKTYLGR